MKEYTIYLGKTLYEGWTRLMTKEFKEFKMEKVEKYGEREEENDALSELTDAMVDFSLQLGKPIRTSNPLDLWEQIKKDVQRIMTRQKKEERDENRPDKD